MDTGAWQAIVHRVAKSQTTLGMQHALDTKFSTAYIWKESINYFALH